MARPSATDRLGRILAMVPWIAAQNGPSIAEVCDRFGISQAQLVADLDVVFVVGLYPYTPESLIEVDFDDDRVWIAYTNYFERPLRLSREEGLALLTAGIASAAQPGHDPNGPLARGVAKIAAVLDVDLDDDLGIVVSPEDAATYAALDAAIAARAVVHLDYFSHARNAATERDVEPLRLFLRDGVWYTDAYCRTSQDQRVFRLDRVSGVTPTGDHFDADVDATASREPDGAGFALGPDVARVVLDLPPSARWIVHQYPVDAVEERPDGMVRATLAVTARPWLDRVLLRAGPGVRVVEGPPEWRDAVSDAAARVLARYRSSP